MHEALKDWRSEGFEFSNTMYRPLSKKTTTNLVSSALSYSPAPSTDTTVWQSISTHPASVSSERRALWKVFSTEQGA